MVYYEFTINGLEAGPQGCAEVCLRSTVEGHDLRVRLGSADVQPLAAELAGLQTVRSRLLPLIARLAQSLHAEITHIQLERGTGNVIEAQLVLAADPDQINLPISFGDGVALARSLALPLYGDASLAPLLRTTAEPTFAVPSTVEAFLNSLSDV